MPDGIKEPKGHDDEPERNGEQKDREPDHQTHQNGEERGDDRVSPARDPTVLSDVDVAGDRAPRVLDFLEEGPRAPKYDPAEVREETRSQLALLLVLLLVLVSLSLIVFTAVSDLKLADAKDLALAILSPLVAVTGTALGFYYGGQGEGK